MSGEVSEMEREGISDRNMIMTMSEICGGFMWEIHV